MIKLSESQIAEMMQILCLWRREGDCILREFRFKNFPMAIEFVKGIADESERAQHHPDIDIRWNKVRLSLTTHDADGLTKKDFSLAKHFDDIASNLDEPKKKKLS